MMTPKENNEALKKNTTAHLKRIQTNQKERTTAS
jgi:hypothetical protein